METIKKGNVKTKQALSVLLVEKSIDTHSALKESLLSFNYKISKHISFSDNLLAILEQTMPDLLILKTDAPTEITLKTLATIKQLSPLPILIFAEKDTPTLIQTSIQSGASAYLVNEIKHEHIKSQIIVASEIFKQTQSLHNELEDTKTQLENRKLIERAKGFIMEQKKISEQQAFQMLRKMAMNNGHSMAIVSKNVIDVHELLNEKYN